MASWYFDESGNFCVEGTSSEGSRAEDFISDENRRGHVKRYYDGDFRGNNPILPYVTGDKKDLDDLKSQFLDEGVEGVD